jgi:hypothetical protein
MPGIEGCWAKSEAVANHNRGANLFMVFSGKG